SMDGTVLQINPAVRKLIGLREDENEKFSPDSLKGYSAWDFYPDNALREEILNTIIEKGEIRNKEVQIYDLNKNLLWVSISSNARYDEEGNLLWIDGVIEDISQRKKSESELIEAKEQAEAANRLKSNFLANMSHELRTPMVAILGFADLLQEDIENEEQRQMAEMISRGGRRLKNTLDLILDLSRIESGGLIADVSPQDISPILQSVYNFYKFVAENKNLAFELKTCDNLNADINASMLEKILENLIENAVTYTNKGKIQIITGTKEFENGPSVYIKVTDTGIGIHEDMYNLIFEPFRQVSEGYSREYEGTGLGLSITKKYVELMNGKIEVESEPGKGSTFTVYLPGCGQDIQKKEEEPNCVTRETEIQNKVKERQKILLVEDDESNAIVISRILQTISGYDVVASGEEAIMKCGKNEYSLILMDIGLRGINGLEAAKRIRKISGYENVPIIATTAFAMTGDRERILKEGCDDYISKPFEINRFLNLIKSYLNP
ncbi:MAG: ATP-binding protein, partial [Bacteroidetes bacterium]|nr:ATP-binding protein [Bacteroidota bacterium]